MIDDNMSDLRQSYNLFTKFNIGLDCGKLAMLGIVFIVASLLLTKGPVHSIELRHLGNCLNIKLWSTASKKTLHYGTITSG